ncbi:two-component system sensor kinase [Leucobacter sp. 7(1)]|uniref:sensor histidine kinase n=1 Tax=Leucobacter sp. 7(1) TaxID=1255613 RepID=UPI00097F3341|nr:histidine kinase [Leucobacter sp. 7(1)]SJN11665.1 two-component system sensor kinase [Leucobacter sp. 7(1)]
MSSSPSAPAATPRPPLRIFLTILHLAAIGVMGWVVVAIFCALLGVGLGTIILLGIGIFPLIGLVYSLFGVGWFEIVRVGALYRLELPELQPVRRQEPGFAGYLRTVWWQFVDGRMWRAVSSFLITCVLGVIMLTFVQSFLWSVVTGIVLLFGGNLRTLPQDTSIVGLLATLDTPLWGILSALISLALAVGIALLHRLITIPLATAGAKAQQLTRQVQASVQQRAGAVRAAEVERTRIERDLHDGVQPRLVSVGMTLGLAQQQIDADPAGAKALIAEAHTSTKAAITELRQLARGIHASVLDDRGLDAALSALAGRSHIPVVLDVRLQGRCSREAETAVYFAIAESLTNAAKHSRASECRVVVRLRDENTLWARVEDNGIGGARVLPGGGLDGITNRIQAAGGTVRIDSPQGGPTSLEVSVPCAS